MGLERRLEALEVKEADANSEWITPIEARVHMKAVARYHARENGKEPPRYTEEEIAHLRNSDLETVEGRGVEARLRDSAGWQSREARELLAAWRRSAYRRLEASEGLPHERWAEVYEHDDERIETMDEPVSITKEQFEQERAERREAEEQAERERREERDLEEMKAAWLAANGVEPTESEVKEALSLKRQGEAVEWERLNREIASRQTRQSF